MAVDDRAGSPVPKPPNDSPDQETARELVVTNDREAFDMARNLCGRAKADRDTVCNGTTQRRIVTCRSRSGIAI